MAMLKLVIDKKYLLSPRAQARASVQTSASRFHSVSFAAPSKCLVLIKC